MKAHMKLEHGPCLVCGYTPLPNDTFDCTVLHGGVASKKNTIMILDSAPSSEGGKSRGKCITIDSDSDSESDSESDSDSDSNEEQEMLTMLREKSPSRSPSILSVSSLSSSKDSNCDSQ